MCPYKQCVEMCLNTFFFFYLFLETSLIFVSHKQVPFWLQHPKAVTTGIHRWHLSVGVTQLQVVVGHHHVNKPVRGGGGETGETRKPKQPSGNEKLPETCCDHDRLQICAATQLTV